METVGVVAFCHGFKITDEFFLYREIGLCSRDGYHHLLLSYSPGHDLSAFSNETQMSIDEQMKYDHGLTFDDTSGRDQNLVAADVKQWYKTHCPSDCPTVGLLDVTPPLKELFQAMDIPAVDLPIGLNEIHDLPIGTTNVMSPSDFIHWCRNHSDGKLPVWHDYCARVLVCKLSWWLRKTLHVQPSVQEVNAQRVLWQKRCDELLEWILCDYCIQEKDDAFAKRLGLDWVPDNCDGKCKIVQYIFEREITDPRWDFSYEDELPECIRKLAIKV